MINWEKWERDHAKAAIHDLNRDEAPSFKEPRCPWCGAAYGDWYEHESLTKDEGESVIECSCEKRYTVTASHCPEFVSVRRP